MGLTPRDSNWVDLGWACKTVSLKTYPPNSKNHSSFEVIAGKAVETGLTQTNGRMCWKISTLFRII